jgi:hypothetical protein
MLPSPHSYNPSRFRKREIRKAVYILPTIDIVSVPKSHDSSWYVLRDFTFLRGQ